MRRLYYLVAMTTCMTVLTGFVFAAIQVFSLMVGRGFHWSSVWDASIIGAIGGLVIGLFSMNDPN